MSDKTRRFILWNSFLYLIALCLALKIVDVSVYGPSHAYAQIGLSRLNLGFRKLLHYSDTYLYSKPWLTVAAVINIICILLCIFWAGMFIREMVKKVRRRRNGQKLLCDGFPLRSCRSILPPSQTLQDKLWPCRGTFAYFRIIPLSACSPLYSLDRKHPVPRMGYLR